jgi:membrane protein implicated in regulation of membrane protease activity
VAVLVTLTVGLVWWVVAWSFGIKAFDAFLVTMFLVVSAAAYVLIKPFLDRLLGRQAAPSEERGAGF